ncbi:MAG TPA: zf-HC2 domain-containing protein [Acidobacteriota bacterium]|jgi:hypothetical protein
MKCQTVREQLPDYLTNNLEETAKAAIREHLTACTWCGKEAEALSEIWHKLGALPDEQPSPLLRVRFEAMMEAYRVGSRQARPGISWAETLHHWWGRLWPERPGLQFATAVTLLILGLFAGHLLVPPRSSDELSELRNEVRSMRQLVALSLLKQESASERLKGVDWSYQMQRPNKEVLTALLNTVKYDSTVNVRLAAVDALHQFADEPIVRQGLIEALRMQDSPLVQIALIDLMVEIREQRAVDVLKRLQRERELNEAVKQRAEWGVKQLS